MGSAVYYFIPEIRVFLFFLTSKFCCTYLTKKFYGSNGPFEVTSSEKKTPPQYHSKATFPHPLLLRETYNQELPQPPPRSIYKRKRRSRRRARLLIRDQRNNAKLKNCNSLPHGDSCQCKRCIPGVLIGKRKIKKSGENVEQHPIKKIKLSDDTPSASSDDEGNFKKMCHEELASPLKNLIPRKTHPQKNDVQRSPIIKITFKSPGGQGKVIKIPSRIHGSPVKNDDTVCDRQLQCVKKIEHEIVNREMTENEAMKELKTRKRRNEKSSFQPPKRSPRFGKNKLKQNHATKVLQRVRRQSLCVHSGAQRVNSSPLEKTKYGGRDLRVILQPIDGKTGLGKCNPIISNKTNSIPVTLARRQRTPAKEEVERMSKNNSPPSKSINVTSCKTPYGVFTQGDVVWAKLRGYPWWPSQINKLIATKIDGRSLQQEAVVAWFQCNTISTIPVKNIESFEKAFDVR